MEAVVKDREDGKIRWVGVTSYNLSTAWKPVTTGLFRSIPFSFNLLKRRQERNDNPYEKHVAGLR
jgi:aryl-alcohol dehydrogenase-like predicted oxidoreductase